MDAYDLELAAYVDSDAELAARVTANLRDGGIEPTPERVAHRVAYFRARAMPDERRRERLIVLLGSRIHDLSEDELLEVEGLCVAIEVNEGPLTQALLDALLACVTWERLGPGSLLRRLRGINETAEG